jgi:hypothetical protein
MGKIKRSIMLTDVTGCHDDDFLSTFLKMLSNYIMWISNAANQCASKNTI